MTTHRRYLSFISSSNHIFSRKKSNIPPYVMYTCQLSLVTFILENVYSFCKLMFSTTTISYIMKCYFNLRLTDSSLSLLSVYLFNRNTRGVMPFFLISSYQSLIKFALPWIILSLITIFFLIWQVSSNLYFFFLKL